MKTTRRMLCSIKTTSPVVVVVVVVDINSLSISIEKRSKKEIEMRK